MQRYTKFFPKGARTSWKSELISTASSKAMKQKIGEFAKLSYDDFETVRSVLDLSLQQPWLEKLRLLAHRNPIHDVTLEFPNLISSSSVDKLGDVLIEDFRKQFESEYLRLYELNKPSDHAEIDMFTCLLSSMDRGEMCQYFNKTDFFPKPKQSDAYIRPISTEWITLKGAAELTDWNQSPFTNPSDGKIILYIHGGAFVMGRPRWAVYQELSLTILQKLQAADPTIDASNCLGILSVDYKLAPEYPYPLPLFDCLAVYEELLNKGVRPENIIIAGDSAGGNLSLALGLALTQVNLPQPHNIILFSPFTDLTMTSDTFSDDVNDPMLPHDAMSIAVNAYLSFIKANKTQTPLLSEPIKGQGFKHPVYPMLVPGALNILFMNTIRTYYKEHAHLYKNDELAMEFFTKPVLSKFEVQMLISTYINMLVNHWSISPILAKPDMVQKLTDILLITGTNEILLGDSVRLLEMIDKTHPSPHDNPKYDIIEKLQFETPTYADETYDSKQSVEPIYTSVHNNNDTKSKVDAYFYPGMFHVFLLSPFLPETKHCIDLVCKYIVEKAKWFTPK